MTRTAQARDTHAAELAQVIAQQREAISDISAKLFALQQHDGKSKQRPASLSTLMDQIQKERQDGADVNEIRSDRLQSDLAINAKELEKLREQLEIQQGHLQNNVKLLMSKLVR